MKRLNLFIPILIISCQFACQEKTSSAEGNVDSHDSTTLSEASVQLSPEQEVITGIRRGNFLKQPLADLVKAPGFIDSPPQYKASINAFITVFVEKIHFIVGDRVAKGQVVITASSPDYVSLQQQYLEILNHHASLKSDFERKQALREDNISSQKEFEEARAAFQTAQAKKSALESNLQLMGTDIPSLEQGTIQSKVFVKSPISGKISALQTSVGQHSAPHEVLMEVINAEHLHVEMKVLEQDITKLREGQAVVFTLPDFEEQLFRGHVYRIGNTIDPKARVVQVHAHLDEENDSFLPGMYINSHVVINQDSVWSVPSDAIVREGSDTFLFVLQETNESGKVYLRKQVRTGIEAMGYTAILHPDEALFQDSVVVAGTYYLSNALNEAGGHDH
ncbi:efflux RND transporter periplasmic adaptor subunit [Cyclobacterium sp.]|uniref:efflux RND transporter periplasmic adaptor subunit n=1 Tax=Cyclobacterium sp. TaxID=1966343 RepID=UPI001993CDF2|nr:efflux RND transporter periplasmic adaptor subunit [Cyclobacterium sp.]MBD3629662.1 efflux RND transporter periplasmic adaptor subunit [Cyclobacterium sp.]